METILILNEMSCRYCLSTENESDLISPCQCIGSTRYVHKKCLKDWYNVINNRVVLPGRFNSVNFGCEICNTPYKVVYKNIENGSNLWTEIFIYISIISLSLLLSYISIGLLMSLSHATIADMQSFWKNVFLNGFIVTHIILACFYIIAGIIACSSSSTGCLCLWIGDCSNGGDEFFILLIFLIAISIIGSILIVYFDILSRVSQRHCNNLRIIEDIKNRESE